MIPFFLRRFGAALVFSLATTFAATAVASLDPEAADVKAGNGDTAEAAFVEASAEAEGADADSSSADADANPGGAHSKPDGARTKPADADAKPGPGDASKAKSCTTGAKGKGGPACAAPSTLKAREEARREGRRNGARSKAGDGELLVWDNVNSVWVSAYGKNTYWVEDRYYRFDEGIWLTSTVLKGPWELTQQHLVPEAPRGRHALPKVSVTATLPSGLEAIYEPRIKVFKIAGRKGVFLFDGVFYRYDGGVWLESKSADGPWVPASSVGLPQSLKRALSPPAKGTRVTLPGGEILVSEGEPNLYAVEGRPDALYFDGTFYERRDQKWFKSASVASGWEEVSSQKIPGTVRSNYHKGVDGKSGRGAGKGKTGDKKKDAGKGGKAGAGKKQGAKKNAAGDEPAAEEE